MKKEKQGAGSREQGYARTRLILAVVLLVAAGAAIAGLTTGSGTGGAGGSLPSQGGNSGKYLTTDGSNASWATLSGGGTVTATAGVLTSNAVMLGAGGSDTKVSTGLTSDGTSKIVLGLAGSNVGSIDFKNGTSGTINLAPTTGALGTTNLVLGTTAGTVATSGNNLSLFASTTSAQLAGVISNESGTGVAVFNDSPTLLTPALGTPSALVLTNATGLPISTGVSGLGTGVATLLATPSSANLAAALTDETGTGVAVFGTSPTFTTQITSPKIVWTGSVQDLTGTGSPEASVTAPVGSVYRRTDGGTSTTLYVKESGSGNTGWIALGTGGGSGAPTGVDYLVGTADGTLSGEIVVGTTPGGELGGTWGSPTIDDGLEVTNWTLTTPTISGAIVFPDGTRQTFNPNGTTPGLNVGSQAGDPSTPSNGDIWYDSTNNTLDARINGATVNLGAGGTLDIDGLSATTEAGVDTDDVLPVSVDGTEMKITLDDFQDWIEGLSLTFTSISVTTLTATDLVIDGGATPTVDAFGEFSSDNNAWAASRGAMTFYDGTAATFLVGVLTSDTPTNGQVPMWNTGGTITWEAPGTGIVTDEAYSSANFNADTTHAVSQDDLYDQLHLGDADDDGKIDVIDLAAAGFVAVNSSGSVVASRSIAEGVSIDVTNGDGASGNPTIAFDATELTGNISWNDGATNTSFTWTFNLSTGTDPVLTLGNGVFNVSTGTLQQAGVNVTTAATTDTFTNKSYDASGTGNTLKFKSLPQFTSPLLVQGTNSTIGTTATTLGYGLVTFSNSTDEASNWAEWRILVPADWDTTVDPRVKVVDLLGGADTSTRQYSFQVASVASSAANAGTLVQKIDVNMSADGSGASGDIEISSTTTLTSWGSAVTPGQMMVIRVARDGDDASDGSSTNSTLIAFELEYGAAQ